MASPVQPLKRLTTALARLPGIGPRSAERIAFHLLKQKIEDVLELAEAIRDTKTRLKHCRICYHLTEAELCDVCADPERDRSVICVVEQPKDVIALEQAGNYQGVYHVLLGRLSPLEGVGPGDLTIGVLMERLAGGEAREVIMGMNPTLDGDSTALLVREKIEGRYPQISVTRFARGLSAGGSIEHANRNMLADAFEGRRRM